MRKLLVVAIALVVTSQFLAGCSAGSKDSDRKDEDTINVTDSLAVMENMLKTIEEERQDSLN